MDGDEGEGGGVEGGGVAALAVLLVVRRVVVEGERGLRGVVGRLLIGGLGADVHVEGVQIVGWARGRALLEGGGEDGGGDGRG